MANLNKVMLIGRLTRKPEEIAGGKGAKFGFAVNNRKQNQATGQWEDEPVFLDCEIWNRGDQGQQATRVLQTLDKGQQIYVEGRLKYDTWEDKNGGGKRSTIRIVVENFQYLEARHDGMGGSEGGGGGTMRAAPRQAMPARQPAAKSYSNDYDDAPMGATAAGGGGGKSEDDIPF